jgi:hypothetical protein
LNENNTIESNISNTRGVDYHLNSSSYHEGNSQTILRQTTNQNIDDSNNATINISNNSNNVFNGDFVTLDMVLFVLIIIYLMMPFCVVSSQNNKNKKKTRDSQNHEKTALSAY